MRYAQQTPWQHIFATLGFLVLAGLVASPHALADEVLFDGKNLDKWKILNCKAEIQDGAILLRAGNGLVQSKRQYTDYVLDFEWKALKTDQWDSGLYFRYAHVPEGKPWPKRYQVNLRQGMEGDLVGFPKAVVKAPIDAHRWNHFRLTVRGTTATLEVNGKTAWRVDGLKTLRGYIALQAEVPHGGQFLFRNIHIRELTATK